jgi:hypothetical protein
MSDLLKYTTAGAMAAATVALLIDYTRLRINERREMRAAQVAAALGDGVRGTCVDAYCNALRFSLCSDGRCKHHCQLECRCP